jgi:hypothetical protein
MDFLTVALRETLNALGEVAGVFIFVGALIAAHHIAVWRVSR